MQFRDWPRTLRPASFRGVSFYVEHDTIETGRRLAIHEFPLKDAPYVEDMGRDTNKISVTAYVVGNDADSHERALRAACERGGPGTLSLPIDRIEAHCESCSREFKKDRLGLVAFSLKFVREGTGGGSAGLPVGFYVSQVGASVVPLVASVAARFASVFETIGRSGAVKDAAADAVRAAAGMIGSVARGLPLAVDLAPVLFKALDDLDRNAASFARAGGVPHEISTTRFVSGDGIATTAAPDAGLVPALAAALETLRLGVDPDTGARALLDLAGYEPAELSPSPRTPSGLREAANAAHLAQALRILALGRYAEALSQRTYPDRRAAIQARADAAEHFASEAERIVPGPGSAGVHRELLTVSAKVSELLSRTISDLAPVITAEAGVSMPALWWSNRLYGDADRAADLIARNRAYHGSFLPTNIEALAR